MKDFIKDHKIYSTIAAITVLLLLFFGIGGAIVSASSSPSPSATSSYQLSSVDSAQMNQARNLTAQLNNQDAGIDSVTSFKCIPQMNGNNGYLRNHFGCFAYDASGNIITSFTMVYNPATSAFCDPYGGIMGCASSSPAQAQSPTSPAETYQAPAETETPAPVTPTPVATPTMSSAEYQGLYQEAYNQTTTDYRDGQTPAIYNESDSEFCMTTIEPSLGNEEPIYAGCMAALSAQQ